MALKIKKMAMPYSKYSIKCPYSMSPTRIVIHNTANDASAQSEIQYMQTNNLQTSFHYAVDDKMAVQGVELWRNAWHAGDGGVTNKNSRYYSYGNLEGIAIEICYSKSGGIRFEKAEQNAAELAAKLLIDFGWGIDKITKHQDYSGKYCPHRTLDMGWDRFVAMVENKKDELLGKKSTVSLTKLTLNGYILERANDFSIVYWDKSKKSGSYSNYINGGFFGYYKEGGVPFTLPRGNLVCDITAETSVRSGIYDTHLKPYVHGSKLRYNTIDNAVDSELRGKKVTTLILPSTGSPYVDEVVSVPSSARYAISGVPVIRNKEDVSFNNFVVPQGWDNSPFYATDRNLIGLKGTSIWIISGTSKTSNFVSNSEIYEALKTFEFDNVIALDGGGSYYHRYQGKSGIVWKDREVNNIVVF